ncbi:MAG: hypothetical protein NVSMB19_17270 [Vulcanimicrobiaceae bacterium]
MGAEHSNVVRGFVSVDGTPVLPTLAQATAEQRAAFADRMGARIAALTPGQFAAAQQTIVPTMVTDPSEAARVAALTATSDPAATGAYARDLYAADLRPQLKNLTVPTLEIALVPASPAPFEGPEAVSKSTSERAADYRSFYASLFIGAPNVRVVPITDSKHFVMIDRPQPLFDEISRFIASLPA